MRRFLLCAVVVFLAATLSHAQSVQPSSECMEDTHPRNICHWSASAGTKGRVCHLDVEGIDRNETCHFEATLGHDAGDHPPICISSANQERIAFESSKKRAFRVRRLIRINETAPNGHACPLHPFRHHFDPAQLNFKDSDDSDVVAADQTPEGCMYKFEVQFRSVDRNGPEEAFDRKRTRYECRDPHIKIVLNPHLPQ